MAVEFTLELRRDAKRYADQLEKFLPEIEANGTYLSIVSDHIERVCEIFRQIETNDAILSFDASDFNMALEELNNKLQELTNVQGYEDKIKPIAVYVKESEELSDYRKRALQKWKKDFRAPKIPCKLNFPADVRESLHNLVDIMRIDCHAKTYEARTHAEKRFVQKMHSVNFTIGDFANQDFCFASGREAVIALQRLELYSAVLAEHDYLGPQEMLKAHADEFEAAMDHAKAVAKNERRLGRDGGESGQGGNGPRNR